MTTFARLADGYALDCQHADTATQLAARFHPDWLAAHPFIQVPDGTLHGARDNGNGTFTNPIVVPPPLPDAVLSRQQLRKHIVKVFGDNGAAAAKLQAYRDGALAEVGTTDAAKRRRLALIVEREDTFTKDEADELMTLFQFVAQDKADVLAAWPKK